CLHRRDAAAVAAGHRAVRRGRGAGRPMGRGPARSLARRGPAVRAEGVAAVTAVRRLGHRQGEPVLLNQDLHVNNVLLAEREPWLVIAPRPLLGERELAVAAVVRECGLGHGRREVWYRLDRLCAELGVGRERARGWSMGYAVVWAFLD